MLGMEHSVVQGGMINLGDVQLASAVSNAGGLGILSDRFAYSHGFTTILPATSPAATSW
jgi:hypothetical protein